MDAATLWLVTDIVIPTLTIGTTLAILLFFNGVVLHFASLLLNAEPPALRRSSIVAVQTFAVQVGLALTCLATIYWSIKHGAMSGIIDTSQLQLLVTDCGADCGISSLNTISTTSREDILSILVDWSSALFWYELSIGALLSISAGLVLSIQLNTTFGNGLWIALIKDMMNVCFFLFIGVAYLALSTISIA